MRKLTKKKFLIPAGIAVLLVIGTLCYFYMSGGSKDGESLYDDYTVRRDSITLSIPGDAVLEPKKQRVISSLITGDVLKDGFEKGQLISAGDFLYSIDTSNAAASIEQMEIAQKQAQRAYEDAERSVADLAVVSPASGLVTSVNMKNGDLAAPDSIIATIADSHSMQLTAPFLADDAARIRAGQSCEITLTDTGAAVSGTVSRVSTGSYSGSYGALVTNVQIRFTNPGAVAPGAKATAVVAGEYACAEEGEVGYSDERYIRAKSQGEISGLTLIAGDRVSAGKTVATLINHSVSSALEAARLGLEDAAAALKRSNESLEKYEIYSTVSGTVVSKSVSAGDQINTANMNSLAVVADLSELIFAVDVDELDIASVRVGQTVSFTADAYPDMTFTGVVDSIDIMGTASGGVTTFPVWVTVRDYGELKPGMNIDVNIITGGAEDILVIPSSAITDGNKVMVKDVSGEYLQKEITAGMTDGKYTEVTGGLSEGDTVGVAK